MITFTELHQFWQRGLGRVCPNNFHRHFLLYVLSASKRNAKANIRPPGAMQKQKNTQES